jgi:hypothetical protein
VQEVANGAALWANLLWGFGAALVGGGATMWFLEPEKAPASAPGASGLSLNVSGTW